MSIYSHAHIIKDAFLKQNSDHLLCLIHFTDAVPYFDDLRDILSHDESERADRYLVQSSREQFIITRAVLRLLLGSLLNLSPQQVLFIKNSYGKPLIDHCLYGFNVSHSHNMAAIIISKCLHVGVDIELMKSRFASKNIANRFFSNLEKNWLSSLLDRDYVDGFYKIWCGKEAVSKAIGKGMHLRLPDYSVIPSDRHQFLNLSSSLDIHAHQWALSYIDVDPDYCCAISALSDCSNVYRHTFF